MLTDCIILKSNFPQLPFQQIFFWIYVSSFIIQSFFFLNFILQKKRQKNIQSSVIIYSPVRSMIHANTNNEKSFFSYLGIKRNSIENHVSGFLFLFETCWTSFWFFIAMQVNHKNVVVFFMCNFAKFGRTGSMQIDIFNAGRFFR